MTREVLDAQATTSLFGALRNTAGVTRATERLDIRQSLDPRDSREESQQLSAHRALGIYAVLFLLIIAFTGISLVFNKPVVEFINFLTASPPHPTPPPSDPDGRG
ncbi:PepSY-associated TM region [Nitrosospira multiformis]|uniref:PepSY-associated TM region n=1 Tax=Nitrosospira multiformis TaxID=1231 RepID=A0A1H8BMJ2_9PROT|nr:PepSY domain-containing protein [Nitrosospira multiformis]SEM83117.1 PepSY-associated TM region [Nitrosospira multiformis]